MYRQSSCRIVRFFVIHWEHFRGRGRRPDLIPFKFPLPRRLKELAFDLVARLLGIGRRKILAASLSRPVHVD